MSTTSAVRSRAEWLVNERAANVRWRPVGRVAMRPERPYVYIVLDPRGKEVTWLSAVFGYMGTGSYSLNTFKAYAEGFLRLARFAWALDLDMSTLRPEGYAVLRAVLNDPERNGLGREYRANTLRETEFGLMTIYNYAVHFGLIEIDNPVRFVVYGDGREAPQSSAHYSRTARLRRHSWIAPRPIEVGPILSPQELELLQSAEDPTDAVLVQLLNEAGPRIGEVLSITLRSLEPERNKIKVRTKSSGGRGFRKVPASDEIFSAIMAYVSFLEDGGIHLGPDDQILRKPAHLERTLTRYDAYHRLGAIVPHTGSQKTRRTTATRLSETLAGPGDARLIAVRDILGHSSVTTTERYLHYNEDQMVADLLSATERAKRREPPAPSRFYAYDVRERVANLKA